MNETNDLKTNTTYFLAIAILFVVVSSIVPPPEGLSRGGLQMMGIILYAVTLWTGNVTNTAVVGLSSLVLVSFLGIMPAQELLHSLGNPTLFFMIGSMAITVAIEKTSIPQKIAKLILSVSRGNRKIIVLLFALATAILSSIMSSIAACALIAPLAFSLIANDSGNEEKDNFSKVLMMAIPFSAMIGGVMTPAGTPGNIICLESLGKIGCEVGFLKWMMIAYPIGILMTFFVAFCLLLVFPFESKANFTFSKNDINISPSPFSVKETKTILIIGFMLVLWILSSWIPQINTTVVAVAGLCLFLFPGIEVITWEDYIHKGGLEVSIMIGSVGALADAAIYSGCADYLISLATGAIGSASPIICYFTIALTICFIHLVIPSGPAVAGLVIAPVLGFAQAKGLNLVVVAMIVTFWAATQMVIPIDAVSAISYKYKRYSFKEMAVCGIPLTIIVLIVSALLFVFWGGQVYKVS